MNKHHKGIVDKWNILTAVKFTNFDTFWIVSNDASDLTIQPGRCEQRLAEL